MTNKETIIILDKIVFIEKHDSIDSLENPDYWIIIRTVANEFAFMYSEKEKRDQKYQELIAHTPKAVIFKD